MSKHVVATHQLSKRYGDRLVVERLSLTVERGEVYGFLGPNGAGKTTTLRMLLGLVRPSAGSASVLGHAPGSPAALAGVGALVEGPGFYPYLSGRQNLRVLAMYSGLDDVAVGAALEQVDLVARAADRFELYSLGMKQRLGVAAALLGDPELLILDEPTNGLDPAGVADMRDLVRALAAQGKTVLLSSHQLTEVQQVCDRVGVIAQGRLLAESTVADLRGGRSLFVRAEPLRVAEDVIGRVVGSDRVCVADGALRILVHVDSASELNRVLVLADIAVHEIRPLERTLEEIFFEMTAPVEVG